MRWRRLKLSPAVRGSDLLLVLGGLDVLHKLPGSPEVALAHGTERTTQPLAHLDDTQGGGGGERGGRGGGRARNPAA